MDHLIVHLVQPIRVPQIQQIIQGGQQIQLIQQIQRIIFKVQEYKRQLITLEILEYLQVNQVIYMDNIIKD